MSTTNPLAHPNDQADGFFSHECEETEGGEQMNTNGPSNRLEALKAREVRLREALAQERVRQQRRRERDHERLVSIVGEVLLGEAARVPDFALMLKQTLANTVSDSRQRQFLEEMGWL